MSSHLYIQIYACFVDFRKAFDSVWHDGLLYKLSKINVQGKLYSLIKSLYSKSTALSGLEITKHDLFNTQEECGKAAF